jgi:hypothetical protein
MKHILILFAALFALLTLPVFAGDFDLHDWRGALMALQLTVAQALL